MFAGLSVFDRVGAGISEAYHVGDVEAAGMSREQAEVVAKGVTRMFIHNFDYPGNAGLPRYPVHRVRDPHRGEIDGWRCGWKYLTYSRARLTSKLY